MAGEKLTTAQLRELENLYTKKVVWVGSITPKRLVNTLNKLIEYGYAQKSDRAAGADVTLTPDGIELAEYRFGSTDPDVCGVLLDEPIPYKPKDSFTVKARIGSVEYVTATRPLDDDSDPQPVIEWHSIDELPMHRFKNAVQRVTFLTWRDRKPLCDINGYKLPQSRTIAPNFNLGANKVLQGVRLQNMAKGGKKSDTRKAMTARQLGRLLKASPISRKPKPRSPLQIQRDLMFLDWIAGGQSPVQIVSRIETPLTGSVRRIA